MKYIIIVLLVVIALSSCKSSEYVYEDMLTITRKYCGDFDTSYVEKKYTKIITDQHVFYINGKVLIDVPKNTRCYVKYIKEYLAPLSTVFVLYFTYDGTDDMYMIKQDYITGKIY